MKKSTDLFCLNLKIDLGLPKFLSLFQKDDQECILSNSKPLSLFLYVLVDTRRKTNLGRNRFAFHICHQLSEK